MKQLLMLVAVSSALALVPASARACGCCSHDHADHHAAHATPAASAKLGPGEVRVEIPVSGMHCGHCASRVEAALGKLDGVKTTEVRLDDGKVIVVIEKAKVPTSKLVETIDALGFKAGAPVQG